MKKTGSQCEHSAERDAALLRAYRDVLRSQRVATLAEASEYVSVMPSPRFWVSEERATIVISSIIRGEDGLRRMLPTKRRMYQEIASRVKALLRQRPRASLYNIVTEVVNSPAPEFYLSARYITDRLTIIRKRTSKNPTI